MKDTHVLYAAGILALFAIICVFIGYATDTLPQHKQRVITISPSTTNATPMTEGVPVPLPLAKKKNCQCCTKRATTFSEKMDTYIQRKKAVSAKTAEKGG